MQSKLFSDENKPFLVPNKPSEEEHKLSVMQSKLSEERNEAPLEQNKLAALRHKPSGDRTKRGAGSNKSKVVSIKPLAVALKAFVEGDNLFAVRVKPLGRTKKSGAVRFEVRAGRDKGGAEGDKAAGPVIPGSVANRARPRHASADAGTIASSRTVGRDLAGAMVERGLTPAFIARSPATVATLRRLIEACPPDGYAGCCAALRDSDQRALAL